MRILQPPIVFITTEAKSMPNQSIGRPSARMPVLVEDFQARWQQTPDLRLMQLLVVALINPKVPGSEVFYAEDA
jgi:hypothetical protein